MSDEAVLPTDYVIPVKQFNYYDIKSVRVIEDVDGIAFYIVNDDIKVFADTHHAQVALVNRWIRNNL